MKKYLHLGLFIAFILTIALSGCGGSSGGGDNDGRDNDGGGTTTYTVTYNGNGNSSGNVPIDSARYKQGQTVTVLGKNTLAKDGLVFAGWTKNTGNSEAICNQGDNFTMGTVDVTLNAKWVLFCDNFNYPSENNWTPINGWTKYDNNDNNSVQWNIVSGGNSANALEYSNNSYPAQLINSYISANCMISIQFKPVNINSGGTFGVIGRAQDEKNYYAVEVYYFGGNTYWRLVKQITNNLSPLDTQKIKDGALDQNTFYTLTLTMNGSSLTGTFSGGGLSPQNITYSDSTWGSGKVGIKVGNSNASFHVIFDNFLVN